MNFGLRRERGRSQEEPRGEREREREMERRSVWPPAEPGGCSGPTRISKSLRRRTGGSEFSEAVNRRQSEFLDWWDTSALMRTRG